MTNMNSINMHSVGAGVRLVRLRNWVRVLIATLVISTTALHSTQSQSAEIQRDGPIRPVSGQYREAAFETFKYFRAIKFIRDICTESFPDLATTNQKAFDDWELRNASTIKEAENHLSIIVWRLVKGHEGSYWAGRDAIGVKLDDIKLELLDEVKAKGAHEHEIRCRNFDAFLQSDLANMARRFQTQLNILRQEPTNSFDSQMPSE